MNRGWYWCIALIIAALGVFSVCGVVLAATPQDYAQGRHLDVKGGAALGVYTLPLEVMTAVKGELSQIALFNAEGNVVPYALRVPEGERRVARTLTLPLFPIASGVVAHGGPTVEVTTQKDGTLARVYVTDRGEPLAGARQVVERYLVDASALKDSIEELSFTVRPNANANADFTWTLHIAAGNSLDHLTHTTYSGTLAKLTHQGTSLDVMAIKTPGLHQPYLAITWNGSAPGVIERVDAAIASERAAVLPQTTELAATRMAILDASNPPSSAGAQRFALVYDAQAVLPLETLQLGVGEANMLAKVDVYVSSQPPQTEMLGTLVYSGNVYRLLHNGATFVSAPIAVNRSERYITVAANQTASEAQLGLHTGRAETWPRLTVKYAPTQVVFVASGRTPFTLAYGSFQPSHALSPSELSAVGASLNEGAMDRDNVTASASFVLGSPTAPQKSLPWKSIGLWSVLIVGVGVLVLMTRNLLRLR